MIDRPMPPDRYGKTVLPTSSFTVSLKGERHPIEISGRYLRCKIHQNDTTRQMIGVVKDTKARCVLLSQAWNQAFAPRAPQDRRDYALEPYPSKAIHEFHAVVCAAMQKEVCETIPLTTDEAAIALRLIPEMHQDPAFLKDIPSWATALEWAAYKRTKDEDLLPFLKTHMDLTYDFTQSDEELRASLRTQVIERCQVAIPASSTHPFMSQPPAWNPPVSSVDHSVDWRNLAIVVEHHAVTPTEEGGFACLIHQDNPRCEADMRDLRQSSPRPYAIQKAALRCLKERLDEKYVAQEFELQKTWLAYPGAWLKADRIYDFIGHQIASARVPGLIAYDVGPDMAERWHRQLALDPREIRICQALAAYRPNLEDGYIGNLTLHWSEDDTNELFPVVTESDEGARSILAYLEAGWRPHQIASEVHQQILSFEGFQPTQTPPDPPRPYSHDAAEVLVSKSSLDGESLEAADAGIAL